MKLVGPAPAVPDDAVTVEYLDDILANYTPGGGGGGGSIASAYAGTWDAGTAYTAGQIVTWHGSTYLAATASTNSAPAVGSSDWTLLAGGLHLAGEYDPGTSYSLGDVVTYQGSSYVGLQPVTGSTPADDLYWTPLALGGPGADGTAATVAVGTVTPLAAGATPTVTNSGSSSAAVLNFGIPAGATGTPGTPGTPGTAGTAATVAVGTVSPLAAGATPTVTNAGSSSAAVLNFGVPAGTAATVAVGTVSPLAAGATPTVTNAGTSAAAVLNFGIPAGATGSTGSTGAPGAPGAAATVAVGTVSPLAAGATPTVTNAGSSSAAVLNFGIPAGATGAAGTPGTPGAAATVAVGTVSPLAAGATPTVNNSGSSSAAVLNFGIPAGATGSTGSTGAPGAAATVAVGTVSPLAAGATPTVTNAGTSAAAVLNFGIPAGATGSTGTPGTAATVAVGTVSPLAAGATPTVNNAGSSSAAVLNFGIPAGATGSTGAPGAAATVAVGTVSPLAAGATPTVTNAGTSAAAVLNFGIPAGATGSTGTPGTAATVAVGTVSPLAAGATPTVNNAGSSSAAVLNFGIPAGATGSTGAPGAAATVAVGTVTPLAAGATPTVTNAGTSAAAVLNFGIPAGATGSTGSTGSPGAPGAAATVAVGTVSPLAAGATPTVTNAGSSSAAVLNFGIPAGATGTAGTAATVAVGTVTPLAAGATPTVTNSGTATAATLNFGIPAGAAGSGGGGLTTTAVKTAAYTAASGQLVLCNAAAGGFTVTLPAAAAGLTVGVKKLDSSSNTVTVVGASGTIDGDPSCTIGVQDAAATLVCDGTNWQVQSTALLNTSTAGSSTGVADAMFSPLYTSGWWYSARQGGTPSALLGSPSTNVSLNNTTVYYIPVFTFKAAAINAVAFTTGPITPSAGTTVRIGVYSASATSGAPTTLITDMGLLTFATTTNTLNTLTASAALPKGWCWFALSVGPQSIGVYGSVITAQMTPVQGIATLSAASFTTAHAVPYYTATGDNALALPASPPALTAAYPSATSALPDFFYKIA